MNRKFGFILVGTGSRGEAWMSSLQRNKNVEVVAFVNTNSMALSRFGEKYKIPKSMLFEDLVVAIRNSEAEGLIDVTPPQFHKYIGEIAFNSNLHLLAEKPMSDHMSSARYLVQAANDSGRIYMISQNARFQPVQRSIKHYVDSGLIGQVEGSVMHYYDGMNFGAEQYRTLMKHPIVADMSIHHFDLMRFILGQDATAVYACGYNPSWSWYHHQAAAMMIIEFGNTYVNYHVSWCNVGKGGYEWRLDGEKGSIISGNGLQHVKGSIWAEGQGRTEEKVIELPLIEMELTDIDYVLREFVSAIQEGRTPECEGKDILKSMAIVFAAIASMERGEKVYLEEILAD